MSISWTANAAAQDAGDRPTAEQVAAIVSGKGTIGQACDALRAQGWKSTIAGNRITVDDRVFVRFVDDGVRTSDDAGAPRWVVYSVNGHPTVWIVGAQSR